MVYLEIENIILIYH